MGQCFSANSTPYQPTYNQPQGNLPNDSARQWQEPAAFANPGPSNFHPAGGQPPPAAQPGATPVRPNPAPRPRQYRNQFLGRVVEQRHLFTEAQQKAIDNLVKFDQSKHLGQKNRQLDPLSNVTERHDIDARKTLNRTASFLLIRDVLNDIYKNASTVVHAQPSQQCSEIFFTQSLLTVQVEALSHQIAIGTDELVKKTVNGERLCPMLMDKAKFDAFLHRQAATLHEVVRCCSLPGETRKTQLIATLEKLAHCYLKSTDRLPSGMKNRESVSWGAVSMEKHELVGVWIGKEVEPATYLYPEPSDIAEPSDIEVAFMGIDPEELTRPGVDPAYGSQDVRFYMMGFEHCDIPHRQAAVFIQKLFFELGWLELSIAEMKGAKGTGPIYEARSAASSSADRQYRGSFAMGDRYDEHDLDPQNQRKGLVDAVSKLNQAAELFQESRNGNKLLCEARLSAWVCSPRFERDLSGLKCPERRAWTMNADLVRTGLLATPTFRMHRSGPV